MNKLCCAFLIATFSYLAQEVTPENPVTAINDVFKSHQFVLWGGTDGSVQEHQLILKLIRSRPFSAAVNDITSACNSLYQPAVDRYVAGENVSVEEIRPAWRNSLAIGPVADRPEEQFFEVVREVNQNLATRQKLRIVCTDGPVDWEKVHSRTDLEPFVPTRDQIFVQIVKEQILAKHRKALLVMGAMHFRRSEGKPSTIERNLQEAGATTYVVLAGSNITGAYDQRDARFLRWKWPWMLQLQGTWLGQLPAKPLLMGGNQSNATIPGTLSDTGDAFVFLGPPDELQTYVPMRSALDGTEYGKETERRLRIIFGEGRKLPNFLPKDDSGIAPKYPHPIH